MVGKLMIPLFITADIPQKTLDELISASQTQNVKDGEIAFAIVNDLSRESLKPVKSKASLPSDISHTKGQKPLECLDLFRKHFNAKQADSSSSNYATEVCAILDEQSEKDETAILLVDYYTGPKTEKEKKEREERIKEKSKQAGVDYEPEDEEELKKTYGKPPATKANPIAEDVTARRLPFKMALEMALTIEAGTGFLEDDIEVQE